MNKAKYVHIGEVGQTLTVTGVVREKKIIHTHKRSGTAHLMFTPWLLRIESGEALVVVVTSARWAAFTGVGTQVTVEGVVKEHRLRHDENLTLLSRAHRLDWSYEDERRRWHTTPGWEVVNPTEAAPRPFPGQTDPLATTQTSALIRALLD